MMLTDTHAHLYAEQFDNDRDEMIKRAAEKKVGRLFLPNIDVSSIDPLMKLTTQYPGVCYPMMGLHPCSVNQEFEKELKTIEETLRANRFCAIGEIGIDLYWDKSTLSMQQEAFRTQVSWAKELNLPIAIHCRDAFNELTALLDELNDEKLSGVLHCFTGNEKEAKQIIEYGNFKLGIGGVVTFKNGGLAELLQQIPIEHIVLETDAPYLAPAPYRGKRNESAYLHEIATKVAECYELSVEEVAEITTANSIELFKL